MPDAVPLDRGCCHAGGMSTPEDTVARAAAGARSLKPGSWESVEALALLASLTGDRTFVAQAQQAAAGLKGAGTWQAVSSLTLLARDERELG